MQIENKIVVQGDWAEIWRFSSQIEHWVAWLPHYRRIKIYGEWEEAGHKKRRAYMSAWRDFLPVGWTTVQTLLPSDQPQEAHVLYNHIGGVTKGMEVVWSFKPLGEERYEIRITHAWTPRWSVISGVGAYLVQKQVVHPIADKTLATVQRLVGLAFSDRKNSSAALFKAAL